MKIKLHNKNARQNSKNYKTKKHKTGGLNIMSKKQFKAESKRLLDLMINSIYTNKEIFLRELISNASDAEDKLYFRSLTDKNIDIKQSDLNIKIIADEKENTLTIVDNGIGMTEEELEKNLGTIAQSGTYNFKNENTNKENSEDAKEQDISSDDKINLIGQFGVGFYSAFMVSDKITVISKSIDSDKAYKWESEGADGYTITACDEINRGTKIILKLKQDTEDETYSKYLKDYHIKSLIKKYSDYIRYPIIMNVEHLEKKEGSEEEVSIFKEETLNSMVPIWKKEKKDIKEDDYKNFYMDKFHDYEAPLKWIHSKVEGQYSFSTLLYIPSHLPFDYYTKEFKKGLALYSNGVMIMENCEDLLPDYFSFVKGLVDSEDLSLNISREMLQQDKGLKVIAKNIENKIKSELISMLQNDRETYEKFFELFGMNLKAGAYDGYGINKDKLQDLLIFHSSNEHKLYSLENNDKKEENKDDIKEESSETSKDNKETTSNSKSSDYTTIKEYVKNMKEGQTDIYYACGESIDKIKMLPQVEGFLDKGYEVLYLSENIDEFVIQVIQNYDGKKFSNITTNGVDVDSKEEKEKLQKVNEESKDMFIFMKNSIEDKNIKEVRFTHKLKNHPVCLTSDGFVTVEMQKVLNRMPDQKDIKAETILEINEDHPVASKIKELYKNNKNDELKDYSKVLFDMAKLIEGLPVDNPTELSNIVCNLLK